MATAVVLVASACTSDEVAPEPDPDDPPAQLSFGVSGSGAEREAWEGVAVEYDDEFDTTVESVTVPETGGSAGGQGAGVAESPEDGLRGLAAAGRLPDVFLADRTDLQWLTEEELVQPVDELLDERGVDFGDGYSRDALQAFSSDNALQCMPVEMSPVVIFYNTSIVDFERMAERGLEVPASTNGWTLGQFESAASFGTRPGRGTRGLGIEPTLRGLSPLVYAAGGSVFEDDPEPVSLAFSSEETREALEAFLPLLRDRPMNLTADQLERRTPLEWFKRGRVGMIAGTRDLVPELRLVEDLEFDVMPMPFLGEDATVGDATGLCLSSETPDTAVAADFLVHALAEESIAEVVRTGEIVPTDLAVSVSDDFVQPGRLPENPQVFTESIRDIRLPPLIDDVGALDAATAPFLSEMITEPVLAPEDLEALGVEIDLASREVLTPGDVDADGIPDEEDDEDDSGLTPVDPEEDDELDPAG